MYCAELLRKSDPEAFQILATTPVKWENDWPQCRIAPIIECGSCSVSGSDRAVTRVFWSPKSGGYAPLLPFSQLNAFYNAKRKLCSLFEAEENMITLSLSPGDLLMFGNTRLLHARSAFDASRISRHLQGLYIDIDAVSGSFLRYQRRANRPLSSTSSLSSDHKGGRGAVRPKFANLRQATTEEMQNMTEEYREEVANNQVARVLDLLRRQRGEHCKLGAQVKKSY